MKYIRRHNFNPDRFLDDTILQKSDGNIELNPTQRVVIHGDLQVTGNIPGPTVSNVLYVTTDGNDDNPGNGLGPEQAKRSLKAALAIAQEGTTIYIRSGEYYEDNPLRVPPKVSIIGDTLRTTTLIPLNGPESFNIINVEKTDQLVTITTETVHNLNPRDRVRISCSESDVDETDVNIFDVPSDTTFRYRQKGANIISTIATGTVLYGKDFFYVNSSSYIAQLVIKHLQAPAYCVNIDSDAIVDTSPYIQNCSNISGPWMRNGVEWIPFQTEQPDLTGVMVTGPRPLLDSEILPAMVDVYGINTSGSGGGMLIDGDRYNSQSPIKSMVADAFTQVTQGGVGFHITNFGYMQLVSCFAVFCDKAFYTTRGGYLSISNSVCDFGNSGFESDGYYLDPYDVGMVTEDYYSTVGSITVNSVGVGFLSAPTVTIDPPTLPSGRQATATAVIDPILGVITNINIDDPGYGYDFQPEVTFSPANGAVATANLSKNLQIDVHQLANKPQVGSIAIFDGDPNAYYVNSTRDSHLSFYYDAQKCSRDVGIILNAVLTDMVFGTNFAATTAGLAYLRSYSSKVTSSQKTQTIDGINQARDLALTYTANPAAQSAITVGFNAVTNIINLGIAGASVPSFSSPFGAEPGYVQAANILQANKAFIQEEVAAWINNTYSTFMYDKAKCGRDVKLILDAVLTDYIFGTNYWTKTAALSYIRSYTSTVTSDQKSQTIAGLNYARDLALALISDTGTETAITNSMAIITSIINAVSGSGAPTTSFTSPLTPVAVGYDAGAAQLEINKTFIGDELIAYINDTLSPGTIPGYNATTCRRDVSYIVEAMAFDLYYGGNSATVGAALAYYNGSAVNVVLSETPEFVSTFTRLQTIIPFIIQADVFSWTKSASNTSTQNVSLTAGSVGAGTEAQALIQIIIDVIVGGESAAPAIQKPTYSKGINYKLKNSYRQAILNEDDKIAYDTTTWLDETYGNFSYNETTCKRDIGYITDAMTYDLIYEGNSQTKIAALAYANGDVIRGQVEQTKSAYEYWQSIVRNIVQNVTITPSAGNLETQNTALSLGSPDPSYGPAQKCEELLQILIDVVDHGTGYVPDPETPPNYSLGDGSLATIRETILADTLTIQDGVIEYLNNTYGGYITVLFTPPIMSVASGTKAKFYNVSTISTASTALEYVGSGVTYNALPFFGGEPDPTKERVEIDQGKCFTVTSDQIGNYRIGQYFTVNAITGEITIDAEKLNLSGLASIGPFRRNGIPVGVQLREVSDSPNMIASTGLVDHNTAPTQYAVSTFVENRYLNKVTTSAETVDSSKVTFAGDVGIDGGDLTTAATTFNLINDTATTVNLAGAGTNVNIGSSSGTTTVNNDVSVHGTSLGTNQGTFNLINDTATTVNIAGAGTSVNIGAATGTTTINNPTVTLANATSVRVNGANPVISSSSTGVLTLFDSAISSVNAFRAATNITIGESSGTLTIQSANTVLNGDLQVKGGDITTNQTAFNLLGTNATTVNAFGVASTLNLADSTGTTTIRNSLQVNINSIFGSDTTSTFTANGDIQFNLKDNTSDVFTISESSNSYFRIDTSNAAEKTTFGTLPLVAFSNTTDASSTISASTTFAGGVGIGKKLYVGTDLNVAGSTTLGDSRTVDTLTVTGVSTFNVPDNTAIAFQVSENTQPYITADTSNGSESVTIEATPKLLVKNTTDNTLGTASTGSAQFTGGVGIAKNLTVGANLTVNTDIVVTGDLAVNGGDLTTTATTFNLLNGNATTINFGGAATTMAVGAAGSSGTVTIKNDNVVLDGDLQVKGGDITTNQTTFNLLNTTATTVNFSGVATSTNIATNAASVSTLTFGPAITGNIFKIGGTASGTINLTSDITTGTVNAYTGITTGTVNIATAGASTTNIGGAGAGVNIGTTGGNSTLTVRGNATAGTATLATNADTAKVFDTTATTVNIAGAGTTITIGNASGATLTTRPDTIVGSNTTQNVYNTTATTVNFAGAGTAVNIGAATGTLTVGNPTITGTNATTFNMNGANPSIVTTSTGTVGVFNTNATTGNLFGVATSVNVGTNAASASTLTFGPASTGNTFKVASASNGTINYTTDVTNGTVNAWQSVTGIINIGSSGTINLGTSTSANTTVVAGAAISGNILKIAGTAGGTVSLNSDVVTGTVELFTNLDHGTLNIATGPFNQINIGSPGSTVTITETLQLGSSLAVLYGGTGLNTITTNGVVFGNGTDPAGVTAASNPGSNATTSYGILTTDASNVPVWTDVIDGGSY